MEYQHGTNISGEYKWTPEGAEPLGHDFTNKVENRSVLYQAATCMHATRYYYSCSRTGCSEHTTNEGGKTKYFTVGSFNYSAHNIELENATGKYRCTWCKQYFEKDGKNYVIQCVHQYGNWEVIHEATYTSNEIERGTCTKNGCNATTEREVEGTKLNGSNGSGSSGTILPTPGITTPGITIPGITPSLPTPGLPSPVLPPSTGIIR